MPHTIDELYAAFIRNNVHLLSDHVFGMPYSELQAKIYPLPKYKTYFIKKRNGSFRVIREPRLEVKQLQILALAYLKNIALSEKPCVHGFVSERSVVTNAKAHIVNSPHFLLNLDLRDFFPSISFYRVRGVLLKHPFNFSHPVASVLAHLCTFRNELPQGAPTSPFFSNLICRRLDTDLMSLAKRHRATYTRYADDLTFSFTVRSSSSLPSNIVDFDSGNLVLGNELTRIIRANSFDINDSKTRISTRRRRMEITGITTNEFPNVPRIYIDKIRGALHAWDRYGYDDADRAWQQKVATGISSPYEKRPWNRQTLGKAPPQLKNYLWGKLLYLRMVRGADDVIYTRMAEKYNALCARQRADVPDFQSSSLPAEHIVRNSTDVDQAVFVIEWSGDYTSALLKEVQMVGAQGTAFAFKRKNLLITCDHVLNFAGTGESIGPPDETVSFQTSYDDPLVSGVNLVVHNPVTHEYSNVRVLHRDPVRDLAVLEFANTPPFHRYFAALDGALRPRESGFLIGFPNWSAGRTANQTRSNITSLFARTGLVRVEISTLIRQGNSGGPFVDSLFRVAGIAQQGALQNSGNDECLSVTELESWLTSVGL